ncbi:MAG: MFS transporter [Gaiellaceae bacterium]
MLAIELLDELVFGAREAAWPLIRDDLSLSYADVGLLITVPNLVAVAVEPGLFFLGDAWRRRALVLGGGVAFALALALAAVVDSPVALLAAFAVLAPASGAFVSLSQATLMDAAPREREVNMTRWTIAGSLGGLAGPFALGGAIWLGWDWRHLFVVLAAAALLLVAVAARWVPFPDRVPAEERPRPRAVAAALGRRNVMRWLVALEASDLLLDVLLGFVALYLVDEVGAARSVGGAAVGIWTGAGLVGGFAVLRLLRRLTGLVYVRYSALAALAIFPLFLLLPGVAAKLAVLALLGLLTAGWYPVVKARLYAALPGTSGVALVTGTLFGVPASLMPLALGLAAERWGLETAMWLLLAGPVLLLVLVPRGSR